MASKSLVDNLKDKDKIIKQINKNGFNILKKYNCIFYLSNQLHF